MDGVCIGGDNVTCEDGTVLVDGACVDPGHIAVDTEEAAEPNGLTVLGEDSDAPAGMVGLKAVGGTLVVHGTIKPFRDLDQDDQQDVDVDTYLISVDGPSLVSISADGLHGLSGGFVSIAAVDGLDNWIRFGVSLSGDTSKRKLFFPAAGTYALAVTDSRSLVQAFAGQLPTAAGAETGGLDFEYYVSITTETVPSATAISPDATGLAHVDGTLAAGDVQLFTIPMGEGVNGVAFDMINDAVTESVVITNNHAGTLGVKSVADGDPVNGAPAAINTIGFRSGDQTIIVADHVFNALTSPVTFTLDVEVQAVGALSTTGADVFVPGDDVNFSTFFYDVAADKEITGMDIAFKNQAGVALPVTGVVVDENFFIFANFTFDPDFGFFFGDTFTSYKGLLRHFSKGRYYFLTFDPQGAATEIHAVSTYAPVATSAVTLGTPVTAQAVNTFGSNPFLYTAGDGTAAWQLFQAVGTGTGNIIKEFFDPAETALGAPGFAFGRMDPILSTCGAFCDDVVPLFTQNTLAAGIVGGGRIVVADKPFLDLKPYLVNVLATTDTGTFDLNFARRDHTDLGTVAVGTPATANNVALADVTDVRRFLFRSAAGNGLTVVVHPDQVTLNTRIQQRDANEAAVGALINNGIAGADDTFVTFQSGAGFTAIEVTSAAAVVGGTFDLTVNASAPVTYTATAGTTTFSDACVGAGGGPVVLDDNDDGRSVATIAAPANFKFFGFAAPQLRMFSNGFISVDPTLLCAGFCFFNNLDIPSAASPNGLIAPFWSDLILDDINGACQKTVGTKLIVQWRGVRFNAPVDPADIVTFQAIVDGATSTIEFVYASTQVSTGEIATVGVENQIGTAANKIGRNAAGIITPGASKLLTPN
ncbi:MAG: hypothetical protein ABI867_34060 [Kofleriaceae bacterium]